MSFRPASAMLAAVMLAGVGGAALALPPITVGAFLTRAAPLRANPLMALVSPDYPALKAEADAATRELKADRDARKAAGKPPIACIPEGQTFGITDMLDGLDALPPADKRLPLKDGYTRVLARRFPCR